jgi:glycosyltransferase involved in cell wall biosynthesis
MTRAARDYQVIFIEEPLRDETKLCDLRTYAPAQNVVAAVPVLPNGLSKNAENAAIRAQLDQYLGSIPAARTICWYYTPMALAFSHHMQADLCVYDCMDELSAFRGAPKALTVMESWLFSRADLVFTGGQSLYESKRHWHEDVHAFPSSIDVHHFAKATVAQPEPEDQRPIARPRVGFFGVIDERMDLALIDRLAALRPAHQFVMVGPVVKIDPASLPRRKNIHWLGPKAYDDLPCYLSGWDVGIMPFAINEATRFISPTKTPEFLAAEVPVVSTPIRDVVRPYGEKGLVEIAATPEQFAHAVDLLAKRPKNAWLAAVKRQLMTTSWDTTWEAMQQLMMSRLSQRKRRARNSLSDSAYLRQSAHV